MADGSRDHKNVWYSTAQLAGLPGMPGTERAVRTRASSQQWQSQQRVGRGGGLEYSFHSLPPQTQAALLLRTHRPEKKPDNAPEIAALWRRYESIPQSLKDIAHRRLRALQAVEALQRNGTRLLEARAIIAAQLQREGVRGGSVASLGRWAAQVDRVEPQHRVAALVPEYVGRTCCVRLETEAWDLFKADYLRLEAPSATGCYERLERIAKARGWKLPALRTFERRIASEIPRGVLILMREGDEALSKTFPAQERDRSVFHALEAVNSDGHRFDVFVRTPLGDIVRPILVGVQDLYSGKMLGYRIAETESSDLIRLAFHDVVEHHGIPSKAWLDNGRGFASKMLTGGAKTRYRFKIRDEDPTGILVALGIEIHWTTPYHGQSKPIERAWLDLCDRIAKHIEFAGAWTGNNPTAKPENYGSKAVKWDVFVRVVNDEIAAHNARAKRKSRVCGGIHSFDEVFAASYAQSPIRKASAEQLRQMLLAAEVVTAHELDGSVRLGGNRYWCEALSKSAGKKVQLRFDPDALHTSVDAYTLGNVYIGSAPCVAAIGFADTSAAREHARARNQFKRAVKDQAKAEVRMDVARVAAQIPPTDTAPTPSASVVAPVFGKPRLSPAEAHAEQLQRTGTDNREHALGDLLKRMQAKRNHDAGFEPPTD